jgi:hypothetical protein
MLLDKEYNSTHIMDYFKEKGYTSLIPLNKRNTKDKKLKKLIKLRNFSKHHKQIYKNRLKVKNNYANMKNGFP